MPMRRSALPLLFGGLLMAWPPWAADALAATPTVTDMTDFIVRLGGYLFPLPAGPDQTKLYWLQVSYKVTPPTSPSNITTITMTKYKKAETSAATANPPSTWTAPTATFVNPSQFVFCAADDYIVETVTVDLRDIAAKTDLPASGSDGGQQTWSIVLHSTGGNLIRVSTQTFAPNCDANPPPDSKIQQKDLDSYTVVFTYKEQAARFQQIVNNAIPTLSPLIFIGTPTQ
jgi:hypothetical protein